MTAEEEESLVEYAIGQPVRCSTAIGTYWFLFLVLGSGPAKSMEKTSKRCVSGMCS